MKTTIQNLLNLLVCLKWQFNNFFLLWSYKRTGGLIFVYQTVIRFCWLFHFVINNNGSLLFHYIWTTITFIFFPSRTIFPSEKYSCSRIGRFNQCQLPAWFPSNFWHKLVCIESNCHSCYSSSEIESVSTQNVSQKKQRCRSFKIFFNSNVTKVVWFSKIWMNHLWKENLDF